MLLKQQQQLLSSIQQKTLPFSRGQENRNQEKKSKRKNQPRNPIKESQQFHKQEKFNFREDKRQQNLPLSFSQNKKKKKKQLLQATLT
jgi:hypothetical protein